MNKNDIEIGDVYYYSDKLMVVVSKDTQMTNYGYFRCREFGSDKIIRVDSDYIDNSIWGNGVTTSWTDSDYTELVASYKGKEKVVCTVKHNTEAVKKILNEFIKHVDNPPTVEVRDINFDNVEVAEINTDGDNIQEIFTSIVGNLSALTAGINDKFSIDSHKELTESFLEARHMILEMTAPTTGAKGFFSRLLNKTEVGKKLTMETKEFYAKNKSTQATIDTIFDAIYAKYENFIVVAENLQKARGTMEQQVDALKELLKMSNAELKKFKKANRPIRKIATNTEIKSSIEKYKQRIVKIDGAIVATQTTIMALAKDLPSTKTDLTDEMAIGSLLTSVDDYQQMYQEAAKLVTEATEVTAVKTYEVVENLLSSQINDTHALEYLKTSANNANKFKEMFKSKTQELAHKIMADSEAVDNLPVTIINTKTNLLVAGG